MKNNIPIIYEDNNILIVEKPEKMLSHPDQKRREPDVLSTFQNQNYAVITRLDFNTKGLMLIAKTKHMASILNDMVTKKQVHKFYQCLVVGYFHITEDTKIAYLLKDSLSSVVRLSETSIQNGQKIITKYKVLNEKNNLSLVEIELITGRTHQIRAHLSFLEHPILGDPLYGNQTINKRYHIKTQQLIASRIAFDFLEEGHPLAYLGGKSFHTQSKLHIV